MSTRDNRHRRKTAHSRPLTRRKIAAAAIDIVREQGPEALSMRRVAATFGVDVAALYRHVRNKDELLEEAGRLASEGVALDAPTEGDLETRFLGLCSAVRDRIGRHPELGIHSGGSPWATPFFARANGLVAEQLHEAGLSGEALVLATQTVLHLVIAMAQSEVLARETPRDQKRAFARTIHESLPEPVRAAWPMASTRIAWSVDFDAFFDFAVRALLDVVMAGAPKPDA
ncbi:MAG: TetR/AcrR family transcriptional regulator [Myxococcota bacterium]|nr:TetR/AcrR family transcriptional regulator [Myxococcota bacterium]